MDREIPSLPHDAGCSSSRGPMRALRRFPWGCPCASTNQDGPEAVEHQQPKEKGEGLALNDSAANHSGYRRTSQRDVWPEDRTKSSHARGEIYSRQGVT